MEWYKQQSKKMKAGVGCLALFFGCAVLGWILQAAGVTPPPETPAPTAVASAPDDSAAAPEEATAEEKAPEPTRAPDTEVPPTAAPTVGESIDVGDHAWMVHAVEDKGQSISSGNQFIPDLETSGRFLFITAGVLNNGDDAFFIQAPKVIDSRGREFDNKSDAFMLIDEAHRCLLEEVNPGLQKDCAWIYEVPGDATGLMLRVTGGLFDQAVDIDLGLGQ